MNILSNSCIRYLENTTFYHWSTVIYMKHPQIIEIIKVYKQSWFRLEHHVVAKIISSKYHLHVLVFFFPKKQHKYFIVLFINGEAEALSITSSTHFDGLMHARHHCSSHFSTWRSAGLFSTRVRGPHMGNHLEINFKTYI